ncbi:MAG: bifunctional oligoribonuclease/PAP phosphatase NrnA [Candidatus Omnitrophica bacterium]|nr:bifunctional oligoribonuclease/PAP phosphatase NrnA [Candidatus Omnitrophota bacterium]
MFRKVIEVISRNRVFLVTAHINLEGDALGSELAMFGLLRKLKKRVFVYNDDITPPIYKFLPYVSVINNDLDRDKFDVALVLDCSDSSRTGKVKDTLSKADCIVNIDHHISNTFFGDINWVDPKASSAAEMIYRLCKEFKVMNKEIALCLYTGIFTDTGNFTYANTTPYVHRIVSKLTKYSISPDRVYENIHSSCSIDDLKFIGSIIHSLKVDQNNKVCWAIIKNWPKMDFDITEVIFSIMKFLKDIEVFILFKKIENRKIRVNFRSRSKVDVDKVAKFFGGGGHKRASGTTIEDSLEAVEKKVISFVRRYTNGKVRINKGRNNSSK